MTFTWKERANGIFYASLGFCAILFCIFTFLIALFSLFAFNMELFAVSMSAQITAYLCIIVISQFVGQIIWYLGEQLGARRVLGVCIIGAVTGLAVEQVLHFLVEIPWGMTGISVLFAFVGFICGFFAYDKAAAMRRERHP